MGRLIWERALRQRTNHPMFAVGSSGLGYALSAHWRRGWARGRTLGLPRARRGRSTGCCLRKLLTGHDGTNRLGRGAWVRVGRDRSSTAGRPRPVGVRDGACRRCEAGDRRPGSPSRGDPGDGVRTRRPPDCGDTGARPRRRRQSASGWAMPWDSSSATCLTPRRARSAGSWSLGATPRARLSTGSTSRCSNWSIPWSPAHRSAVLWRVGRSSMDSNSF